ncbi:MAG: hypothetical protein WBV39_15595, partial [Rudaea sp.]
MDAHGIDALLGNAQHDRIESWRYSRNAVRALSQQEFGAADPALTPCPESLRAIDLPLSRGRRIVFVNGVYSATHSDVVLFGDTPGLSVRHDSANRCELIVSTTADGPVHLVYLSVPGEAAGFW